MEYILPKKIAKGSTIGIVALSGALESEDYVLRGVKKLEELGFSVKLSEHLFDKKRYLAGEDEIRASELERFFEDPDINCILCARGGYGAIRILDKINYELIKANPKAFCGYSDITAFSAMLLKKAGLITYSAPMLCGDFGAEEVSDFTIENFLKAIQGELLEFEVNGDSQLSAQGIAWGGNLTTLASLCGRDFIPKTEFVLFVEDVNEPLYKLDRCLAQLAVISDFKQNIRGIVTGDFTGLDSYNWALDDLLGEYAGALEAPLWQGLKWGHEREKVTIPIGRNCLITGNKITFL